MRPRLGNRERCRRLAGWLIDLATCWIPRARPRGAVDRPGRISLLALWGIGDAIFLIPLLRALRRRYPHCEIEVLGKPFLEELLRREPAVDQVTKCEPPWTKAEGKYRLASSDYRRFLVWLWRSRREQRDWIVTTRGDVREHLLAALLGGRRRFGFGRAGGGRLLTDDFPAEPPLRRSIHMVEVGREIARWLGAADGGGVPEIALDASECAAARSVLYREGLTVRRPLLGVHVGASFPIRQWGAESFERVLEELGEAIGGVVLIADPQGAWRELSLPAGLPGAVFEGDLRQVCALLAQLDVLLCNDSGVMHAATAVGTPVVAPFGPTSAVWFRPFGHLHRVVQRAAFACGPCTDHCHRGEPDCIRSLPVERVVDALRPKLASLGAASSF
jgi:ADP-heptose:LPS heptosyltransferase